MTLTGEGLRVALALETVEPTLSAIGFSARLDELCKEVAQGALPAKALMELAPMLSPDVVDGLDANGLQKLAQRIWRTPEDITENASERTPYALITEAG